MVADETLYATKGYTSVIRWVDPSINIDAYIEQRVDNGGGATIAGNIMGADAQTQGYVTIAAETHVGFLGVCLGYTVPVADYDLDEAITAGETIDILRPTGGRTIIACILCSHVSTFSIEEGDYLRISDEAGKLESFVYTDTADSTDTFEIVVGKSVDDTITLSTSDIVIHVWY